MFISTGRSLAELPDHLLSIGFDGVIAASGGYVALSDGRVLARLPIDPAVARQAIDLLQSLGVSHFLETDAGIVGDLDAIRTLRELVYRDVRDDVTRRRIDAGFGTVIARMTTAPVRPPAEIDKIVFLDAAEQMDRIRDALQGRLTVSPPSVPRLGPGSGELTVPGVHKGRAVRLVLDTLDIPVEHSVGFGDGVNDVEMLRVVGVGVAMADASPEALAVASQVTESVERDGVARAFVRLGLVPEAGGRPLPGG